MTLWYSRHNLWDIYSADCSWPSCTTWWDGKFTISEEFRCSICNRWSWRTYQRKQCISARQWLCRNSGQLRFQHWGMSLYPGNVVCHCFLFFWLGHRELLSIAGKRVFDSELNIWFWTSYASEVDVLLQSTWQTSCIWAKSSSLVTIRHWWNQWQNPEMLISIW